eukprot:scaffold89044_cov57-Phaeocystis_antarctica.AAC.1
MDSGMETAVRGRGLVEGGVRRQSGEKLLLESAGWSKFEVTRLTPWRAARAGARDNSCYRDRGPRKLSTPSARAVHARAWSRWLSPPPTARTRVTVNSRASRTWRRPPASHA